MKVEFQMVTAMEFSQPELLSIFATYKKDYEVGMRSAETQYNHTNKTFFSFEAFKNLI